MVYSDNSAVVSFPTPASFFDSFEMEKVLNQDPVNKSFWLLGTAIPAGTLDPTRREPALLRLAQTPLDPSATNALAVSAAWKQLDMVTTNSIYATMIGQSIAGGGEFQLSIICPATDKHIKKYSLQESQIIRETPELYTSIVEPYINALPVVSISWLYAILDGTAEAEAVIYRDEDPISGFVVTPDLKWDQKTLSSLYLLVIPLIKSLRSIRDLTVDHLPLLRKIKVETERNAKEKYGVGAGQLRLFVHYQPSYYHFHVHVVHIQNTGFMGSTVGQAHLLSDLIDNLELELASSSAVPHYRQRTFEYSLGKEHPLFQSLDG